MSEVKKNRLAQRFQMLGIVLLVAFVALPLSIKLLHNSGFLEGWDGFGLFVIGMRLLPWGTGLGIIFFILGIVLKGKRSPANTID